MSKQKACPACTGHPEKRKGCQSCGGTGVVYVPEPEEAAVTESPTDLTGL